MAIRAVPSAHHQQAGRAARGRATPREAAPVGAPRDGWLTPVELQGEAMAESQPAERRASNEGFLPLRLEQYTNRYDSRPSLEVHEPLCCRHLGA